MSKDNDDFEKLKLQALPVMPLEGFDPSKIPCSAEDYLRNVVWEANQIDDVVTVPFDSSKAKKIKPLIQKTEKMKAPTGFAPSLEVQKEFLAQFSHLTSKIDRCKTTKNFPNAPVRLPKSDDHDRWCQFCFGSDFYRKIKSSEDEEVSSTLEDSSGHAPLLSIVLNIPMICLENLLEWHANWLNIAGFSDSQGRWLYSLFACLERPLTPDTCSVLRCVLKSCSVIRASLETDDHPDLIQLNMLITIISKYYNQDDLADN